MSDQQEVIKRFMRALDKTPFGGTKAIDAALRKCSEFLSLDALIDQFVADCENAEDADMFLLEKCGIDLDNGDTGAITGFDAGGFIVKTKDSIVEEIGDANYPEGTSFEINGLTINIPEQSELTDAQQNVIKGLYSWWLSGALNLIADSVPKARQPSTRSRLNLFRAEISSRKSDIDTICRAARRHGSFCRLT